MLTPRQLELLKSMLGASGSSLVLAEYPNNSADCNALLEHGYILLVGSIHDVKCYAVTEAGRQAVRSVFLGAVYGAQAQVPEPSPFTDLIEVLGAMRDLTLPYAVDRALDELHIPGQHTPPALVGAMALLKALIDQCEEVVAEEASDGRECPEEKGQARRLRAMHAKCIEIWKGP